MQTLNRAIKAAIVGTKLRSLCSYILISARTAHTWEFIQHGQCHCIVHDSNCYLNTKPTA